MKQDAYAKAGVDIDSGNQAVDRIKASVKATYTDEVISELGDFGSAVTLPTDVEQPVLVSSADGVGTKLLLAIAADNHMSIGQDLVAMVINDIAAKGAKPLFLQDYLAVGHLNPAVASEIVAGIAAAAKKVNAALVGGEMAEMPGLYDKTHYDLAAFGVGVVARDNLLDPARNTRSGDWLIGLASNGLHSNGYSLVRKVLGLKNAHDFKQLPQSLQETLLTPTRLYSPLIESLTQQRLIAGISHITGGGIIENLPRAFNQNLQALINGGSWDIPEIFGLLKTRGHLTDKDMLNTFNNGLGMVLVVHPEDLPQVLGHFDQLNEPIYQIGQLQTKSDAKQSAVVFKGAIQW